MDKNVETHAPILFDPQKDRDGFLREDSAILRWRLQRHMGANAPSGHIAAYDLCAVVHAWLAGLHAEIAPVIPRALAWLTAAINADERFGESQELHRQTLHWSRALGRWMAEGSQDIDDWSAAMRFAEPVMSGDQQPAPTREDIQQRLDDFMACAVQSGHYARGIETYERLAGATQRNPRELLEPRSYAYCVCLGHEKGMYDEEALFAAGRRMLQANLEEKWLGAGQGVRAATWLKIVYWDRLVRLGDTATLTPLQTVLKAYENMPRVPTPRFLSL